MKKTTLKTYLLILIVLMLSFAIMLTAFACKNDESEEEQPEEETTSEETESTFDSLITNGNFSSVSSTSSYPASPSSWSTYTGSNVSASDSVKGVIDTGSDFEAYSSAWNGVNPFGKITEEKVLMVYNNTEEGNAYGYYASFSTDAYGYYSVSVDVKVQDVASESGATFLVKSDNNIILFDAINATDAFETYTIYFRAPSENDKSVTVQLSLGYNDKKVAGYAFFDNVVAKKIKESDYLAAKADAKTKIGSLSYPDGEFRYYTADSSKKFQEPNAWSTGYPSGETISTVKSGIVTVPATAADWDSEEYGAYPYLPEGSKDNHILTIMASANSSNTYTQVGYYYESKGEITIAPSHYYEISLYVKATVDSDDSITDYTKKGARVVLYDSDKSEAISVSGIINTTQVDPEVPERNNGWEKVVFRVLGDKYTSKSFKIRLWLGYENEWEYMQGKVYFDELTVTDHGVIESDTPYDIIEDFFGVDPNEIKFISDIVDLGTDSKSQEYLSIDDALPANWTFAANGSVKENSKENLVKIISKADLADSEKKVNWKETYGLEENPLYPYTFSPVILVNNLYPTSYAMTQTDRFEIKQNLCYRISVWIKTVGLEDGKTVELNLMREPNKNVEETDDQSAISFSVNTTNYINDLTNNYAEYVFYVAGDNAYADGETQSREVYFVFSNGSQSATAYDPTSYQKGAFIIAGINYEVIPYSDFPSSTSSDYEKTYSFNYTPKSASSNGSFDNYEMKNSEVDEETGYLKPYDKDGKVQLGVASSWTNNANADYGKTMLTKNEEEDANSKFTLEKKANSTDDIKMDIPAGVDVDKISSIEIKGKMKITLSTDATREKYIVKNDNTFTWATHPATAKLTGTDYTLKVQIKDPNSTTETVDLAMKKPTGDTPATLELEEGHTYDKFTELTGEVTYFLTTKTEWETFFTIDKEAKTISFKSASSLISGEAYEIVIHTNQVAQNDLVSGIVNVDNVAQLDALGLSRDEIYGDWAESVKGNIRLLDTDFGAPNLYILTNKVTGKEISLNPASGYKQETLTDLTAKAAIKTSSTISLSAESYYRLTIYAKALDGAIGQIYITSSNHNVELPHYTVKETDGWMEYNFLIETGLSSVSAYIEVYYGEKGNKDDTYHGTLLIDSFYQTKIESDEYASLKTASTQSAKFTTITFDKDITDGNAATPSGFSAGNGSSNNDSSSIISGIINKDYDFSKLGVYKDVTSTDADGNTTTTEEKDTSVSFTKDSVFNNEDLGDYILIIDNVKKNYQDYTFSTSSLQSNKYYKFTAMLRTSNLDEGKAASVFVKSNDISYTINVDTKNDWKEYTFYLSNTKSDTQSAELTFRLGENTDNGKMRGLLFIDNVSLSAIEESEYKTATANLDESVSRNIVLKTETSTSPEESEENGEDGEEEEESSLNTTLLWTYITAIVIAVALIAVIAIWLIKKYRRTGRKGLGDKRASYDRENKPQEEDAEKSGSARDEYKD